MAETPRYSSTHRAIVEAIVALNFNEADKALDILLTALSDSNFERNSDGIRRTAN